MSDDPTFRREGDLVLFRQYGPKLALDDAVPNTDYFAWLDEITDTIGDHIPGAEIREKENDRIEPRRNTGVYYDTTDLQLLHGHMVLRTTSNPKTHAFCAFKYGLDQNDVRRDHRYIFDGDRKRTIQLQPTSPAAAAVVHELLARTDIQHPGTFLAQATGIRGDQLEPALCVAQYRYTFYVLLDGQDALRCSLDRADVENLRQPAGVRDRGTFSEIELPIYPRIEPSVLADPRTRALMDLLSGALAARFQARPVADSKYRRAARVLTIGQLNNIE
ncbi:hypothetical protein OG809_33190 [Kribbella soli]